MTQQEASGRDMGAELSQGTLHKQVMPKDQICALSRSLMSHKPPASSPQRNTAGQPGRKGMGACALN